MQLRRRKTDDADAAATTSDEQLRRLQSQLQSTAEQPAVVEQVVGASDSQAVEPGLPGQPQEQPPAKRLKTAAAAAAAATTPQPVVPRYVVPPATGDLAYGRSHWDRKPAEIHAMILKHAGPLTLFVNGLLGDKATLDEATTLRLWTDAFKMDWQGDLALLPDVWLSADNGLMLAHSRSMYGRLCKRFPEQTERFYAGYDAANNTYDESRNLVYMDHSRLLLIPMRHSWFDLIDFTYPIALARIAIYFGCLDLLKHLDDKYKTLQRWMAKHDPTTPYWHYVVDQAALYGHLDVVQYLFSLGVSCTTEAMDSAAGNGHLHVVIWLHENRREGCTTSAMDGAARNGHLHVVKWLHTNRTEGCTTAAMNNAAGNGHLHVVKWLHENRTEGCTAYVMNSVAIFGHLHVIKWLHENRTEGCTQKAMAHAVQCGRLHVVKWLHETRRVECTPAAMDAAIMRGQMDVVKYMHSKGVRASSNAVETAVRWGHIEMLRYLLDCGYAVGLGALECARNADIANILLGSLTLDRAQALLAEANRRNASKATIERLESTIKKLQESST